MKAFVKVLRVSTFATCMKMRRLTDVVYHSGLDDFKYRSTISVRENMGCLCFLETLSLCRSPAKVLLLASAAWRTMAVSNQVPQCLFISINRFWYHMIISVEGVCSFHIFWLIPTRKALLCNFPVTKKHPHLVAENTFVGDQILATWHKGAQA